MSDPLPNEVVLSLFTGAGLLDRGFEQAGFCVVSAGDIKLGRDVRGFRPARHKFDGVIGGPPCQGFSRVNRTGAGLDESLELVGEYVRVVCDAAPQWFLCENVPAVPDLAPLFAARGVTDYTIQRFNLNPREFGFPQNRLRTFQFGSRDGAGLVIDRLGRAAESHALGFVSDRAVTQTVAFKRECRAVLASEGRRKDRRTFADVCALQGLPRDFALPGLSRALQYELVGNGSCPVQLARVIAGAISTRSVTRWQRVCVCECGQPVPEGHTLATAACRKRMERRRKRSDAAAVTGPGIVTGELAL
jgi:DNA (cytosine-5)-methyltransferase 1